MSVNKAILLGNLGKDPELRRTNSQMPVCTFSIATSERRKDATGNYAEHTEWHNIVVFGVVAENCAKYLKKGRQAFIEGRITTRKWQDKEGKDRYTTEIVANTVQFIGTKQDGPGDSSSHSSEAEHSYGAPSSMSPVMSSLKSADSINSMESSSFDDDDIPF